MNRRGFIFGAGALAAPSIIGISGILQLSRPALVSVPILMEAELRFVRLTFSYPMGIISYSDWADLARFGERISLLS